MQPKDHDEMHKAEKFRNRKGKWKNELQRKMQPKDHDEMHKAEKFRKKPKDSKQNSCQYSRTTHNFFGREA